MVFDHVAPHRKSDLGPEVLRCNVCPCAPFLETSLLENNDRVIVNQDAPHPTDHRLPLPSLLLVQLKLLDVDRSYVPAGGCKKGNAIMESSPSRTSSGVLAMKWAVARDVGDINDNSLLIIFIGPN